MFIAMDQAFPRYSPARQALIRSLFRPVVVDASVMDVDTCLEVSSKMVNPYTLHQAAIS